MVVYMDLTTKKSIQPTTKQQSNKATQQPQQPQQPPQPPQPQQPQQPPSQVCPNFESHIVIQLSQF